VQEANGFGTLIGRVELSAEMDLRPVMAPRGSEGADRGFHRGLLDGYHFTCLSSSPDHVALDLLGTLVVPRYRTCGTNASRRSSSALRVPAPVVDQALAARSRQAGCFAQGPQTVADYGVSSPESCTARASAGLVGRRLRKASGSERTHYVAIDSKRSLRSMSPGVVVQNPLLQ
jgi:hypothetical protein